MPPTEFFAGGRNRPSKPTHGEPTRHIYGVCGVPTEDIDAVLAQLIDVSVALMRHSKDAEHRIYAVDYSPLRVGGEHKVS